MRFMRPANGHGNDRHRRRRGQSLVEFAIVLPILLFLTLVALDFGRVYLGWINLQSMSRIAANLAANNPTAWQRRRRCRRTGQVPEPDPQRRGRDELPAADGRWGDDRPGSDIQ